MNNENNTFKVLTVEEQVIDYFNSSPLIEKEEIIVRKIKRPEVRVFKKSDLLANEELDIVLQNLLEQDSIVLMDEDEETITYRNNTILCEDSETVYSSIEELLSTSAQSETEKTNQEMMEIEIPTEN